MTVPAGRPPDGRNVHQRLHSQLLFANAATKPETVVAHFGAMQAQDYLGALWAVGLRTGDAVERDVERSIEERRIVRSWPMRGTLHFVAASDLRWMLELLAPRILARHRQRLEREFGIDRATLRRCRTTVQRALRGNAGLTRPELYATLEKSGIAAGGGRGLHIVFSLAHESLICFGPRNGKQHTFVLLDEWVPASPPKDRDEALTELARRYLRSHGPATASDFAWWSGLTLGEAKEAFALAGKESHPQRRGRAKTTVHLLPPFDEYTVAYRDRSAMVDPAVAKKVNAGGGMINAVVVVNGIVAGTWKRRLHGKRVEIVPSLFRELNAEERDGLEKAGERYRSFLGAPTVSLLRPD